MKNRCWFALAALLAIVPAVAGAAPQGKVVIAKGVDPSTLDTMNQQETPASVVAAHIYDTLVERDQSEGSLLSNYDNADLDGMVDEAQRTMDDKKRLEIYHRVNRLWIDDAAAVPLYQQVDLYGASKRLNWKARSDEQIKAFEMSFRESK